MAIEVWDLYDAHAQKTGLTMVRGESVPAGLYHLAVHIWPINSKGEFLVQRRAPTVQWNPNLWAVTGGSAIQGEDGVSAALRELREEIGLHVKPEDLLQIARLRRTNSFCCIYAVCTDQAVEDFVLQKEEVSAVRWCDQAKIQQMRFDNQLYNYGDAYYRMLFAFRDKLL